MVTVWVHMKIYSNGDVIDAKATRWQLTIENSIDDPGYWASRPEQPFLTAAENAALQWKFAPPDVNTSPEVDVVFTFRNIPGGVSGGAIGGVVGRGGAAEARVSTLGAGRPNVVRIGGAIKPPEKIVNVPPVYPDVAKSARVQGVVILDVLIGADGSVIDAQILRSIPLLDAAALDAVRQWKFRPILLNGAPVDVVMTATVNFTLQ
jgi:protein TonB